MQPAQKAIESLFAKDLCPRLHVDVTHADAVCPDFVRDKWQQRLVIDLDPSYPLELSFTELGVEANLSFGGYVTRCTFPWTAIYIVSERGTGKGQVFERYIPASLRSQIAPLSIDPKLTEVSSDKSKSPSRRRKRRRPAKGPKLASVEALSEAEPAAETEPAAEVEPSTEAEPAVKAVEEQKVKSRRAAFKVIDGGS